MSYSPASISSSSRRRGRSSSTTRVRARTGRRCLVSGRGTPQNLDVQATLAVYTVGRELHVLNLATRRDSVLARPSHGVEFAQIEAPGVVYAGNVPNAGAGAGTLVFVPFARVAAAVS